MKKCLTCKNYILAYKLPQGGIIMGGEPKEVAYICTKGIKGVEPNACCNLWEAHTNGLVGELNVKG